MKRNIIFLSALILIVSFCKSQTAPIEITGNYIGQLVFDKSVVTIEVKKNQKYILKSYNSRRVLQKKVKGKWTLNGDKLILYEKSGETTVLEKFKDIWYIADKNGRTCLARFYQNKDPKVFWTQLRQEGC